MAKTKSKSNSRKTRVSIHKTKHKTSSRKTTHPRKPRASTHTTSHRSVKHRSIGETYVFECTRLGCGYKIVREEKAEIGQTRSDLKCPKCHNTEFRCQGKGDLPEPIEMSLPIPTIDFDRMNPVDLGSN